MTVLDGGPDRLGTGDLMTFWAEQPGSAWNIALAGLLEPDGVPLTDDWLRDTMDHRLDAAPALRRRVRWTHFGRPVWIDDEQFDIARHVAVVRLAGATTAQFLDWTASWAAQPFDRGRPLWRMALVAGLRDGTVGVAIAVHHAVADGVGGATLAALLMDGLQHRPAASRRPWRPLPPPSTAALAADAVGTWLRVVTRAVRAAPRWPAAMRAVRADLRATGRALRGRAPELGLPSPRGADRILVATTWRLDAVKAVGRRHGATINDVVLAAVAGGMRRFLGTEGGPPLRASVPVAGPPGARNAGGTLPMVVSLPVAEPDPAAALAAIRTQTAALKAARDRRYPGLAASPLMPTAPVRAWTRWLRRHGGRRVNLFVTNVPGPAAELRFGGMRLRVVYPIAPVVAGVPLAIAVLSYAGELSLTVNAAPELVDPDRIVDGATAAFEALSVGWTRVDDRRHAVS
jgi:WS/DGAT/MGAT family acyltransferase